MSGISGFGMRILKNSIQLETTCTNGFTCPCFQGWAPRYMYSVHMFVLCGCGVYCVWVSCRNFIIAAVTSYNTATCFILEMWYNSVIWDPLGTEESVRSVIFEVKDAICPAESDSIDREPSYRRLSFQLVYALFFMRRLHTPQIRVHVRNRVIMVTVLMGNSPDHPMDDYKAQLPIRS